MNKKYIAIFAVLALIVWLVVTNKISIFKKETEPISEPIHDPSKPIALDVSGAPNMGGIAPPPIVLPVHQTPTFVPPHTPINTAPVVMTMPPHTPINTAPVVVDMAQPFAIAQAIGGLPNKLRTPQFVAQF